MGATGGEGEKVGTMERVGRREGTGGVLDGALVEVNIKPPFPPPPPPPSHCRGSKIYVLVNTLLRLLKGSCCCAGPIQYMDEHKITMPSCTWTQCMNRQET